jgi:hypothetical protein
MFGIQFQCGMYPSNRQGSNEAESMLEMEDIRYAIRQACCLVGARRRGGAPATGAGIPCETYWTAISRSLEMEFAGEPCTVSLFGSLREQIPDLTEECYKLMHRNALEYLLKLVRKESRAVLMKDLELSAPWVSAGKT